MKMVEKTGGLWYNKYMLNKKANKSVNIKKLEHKKTAVKSGAIAVEKRQQRANNVKAGAFQAMEKYWLDSSDDALDTARRLIRGKKYVHAMFFLHLAVEKILKGLYINQNKEDAPIGHNLHKLAEKIKNIGITGENNKILTQITAFNIAARYDDYKQSFYRACTEKFAKEYMKKGKELILWLKSRFA